MLWSFLCNSIIVSYSVDGNILSLVEWRMWFINGLKTITGRIPYLPEPAALQYTQACPKKLQYYIPTEKDFKKDADGATKHSHQQESMDMNVKHFTAMHMIIK